MDYGKRYDIKQVVGISNFRHDNSVSQRKHHEEGGAAEAFVAETLGLVVNNDITYGGDEGFDLVSKRGSTIDVKWISWTGPDKYLKVNPEDRPADIYILVCGRQREGFQIVGWATREEVVNSTPIDFGYGPKLAVHERDLHPL